MTRHFVTSNPVNVVHSDFFAQNDGTASPTGMSKVAAAFNYVSCRQKKVILVASQDFSNTNNSSAINVAWPHYFRTGENTSGLSVRLGIVPSDAVAASQTVNYVLRAFSTGDNTDALTASFIHEVEGQVASTSLVPSDLLFRSFHVDGLASNTEYHGYFSLTNSVRVAFTSIHESWQMTADDSVTAVVNPDKFHVEGPIYDEHAQDLCEANNKLWRHNGAPYINWSCDYPSSGAPGTTSAAFADVISDSAGFYVNTAYHSTRRRTGASGVPVKMGVKTFRTGAACDAEFRLTDGTNNIDITGVTVPTATSTRWFTTTATISDTPATWRMQAKRTAGTGTVNIEAWTLFPYEA